MKIVTIPSPFIERQRANDTCAACHQKTMSVRMWETMGGDLLGVSVSCPCGHKRSFDKHGTTTTIIHTSTPESVIADDEEK